MPIQFPQDSSIPDDYQPPKPQPKPVAPTPASSEQQYGPGLTIPLEGVAKFIEEKIGIPGADLVDNVLQGNNKTPAEIATERADKRTISAVRNQNLRELNPNDYPEGPARRGAGSLEGIKAVLGGAEDLVTGISNLPSQLTEMVTGKPLYQPINTGIITENNTTAGQGLRTLSRYAFSAAIPIPGLGGASGLGVKAFATRAAEGGVQDFLAASGTTEDSTFIGNIPGLSFLQTNEKYNPIQNRAVVAFEGALMNAGFGQGADLGRVFNWVKAGRPAAVTWVKNGRPASGAVAAQAAESGKSMNLVIPLNMVVVLMNWLLMGGRLPPSLLTPPLKFGWTLRWGASCQSVIKASKCQPSPSPLQLSVHKLLPLYPLLPPPLLLSTSKQLI
jgi:hypothetical protein